MTQHTLSAGKPRVLFEGTYLAGQGMRTASYDVSPDGQRFLMVKDTDQTTSATEIIVVQNWVEELKRLVPVR